MDASILPPLLALPAEIIQHILSFVPPTTLGALSATCQHIRQHACTDRLWQQLVNDNLPEPLTSPSPLSSFRELYLAHHPNWFLPRHQLWYADSEPNGKLLIARYDPRRGCIEAYAVVAERGLHTFKLWQHDASVAIHSFDPRIQLDLNQPVLKLDVGSPRADINPPPRRQPRSMSNWFRPSSLYHQESEDDYDRTESSPPLSQEVLMDCSAPAGLFTSFMLARDHPPELTSTGTAVWPPMQLPALSRTRNSSAGSFSASGHRPRSHREVSQNTFRLRKWIEFSPRQHISTINLTNPEERIYDSINRGYDNHLRGLNGQGVRMGEDVATYATLPRACYTPTKEKPWRGIWCGDYSGHGCEFLVVLQPDEGEESPLPQGMEWMHEWLTTGIRRRGSSSSWGSYASAHDGVLTGSLLHYNQDEADESALDDDDYNDDDDEGTETIINTPTEDTPPTTARSRSASLTAEQAHQGENTYSGRLEAIKLTGDSNIPRAQHTFIAPDIGDGGLVRIAQEEPFKNARVVRSAGHIAGRGYVHGMSSPFTFFVPNFDLDVPW